jgi:hypothetical protein
MDYNLKLEMFQKIYIVFGDPKKQTVLSAVVSHIAINTKDLDEKEFSVTYTYSRIKLVRTKSKMLQKDKDNFISCGSVEGKYIDLKSRKEIYSFGMHNWPVFTSKEKCIEYLRCFKNG